MKTIIAGPRDIMPPQADRLVGDAIAASGWTWAITEIIHGAASGIDTAAGRYCKTAWPVTPFPADWAKHGRAAGPIRNAAMADAADALIAIWDGQSRGTKNMIDAAQKRGLKVYVHLFER